MDKEQKIKLLEYRINILGNIVEWLLGLYSADNHLRTPAIDAVIEQWNKQESEALEKVQQHGTGE